jgi:hypothetical protein
MAAGDKPAGRRGTRPAAGAVLATRPPRPTADRPGSLRNADAFPGITGTFRAPDPYATAMSYPARDTSPQHAQVRHGLRLRRRAVPAVLAIALTLAAIGCASVAPTLMHAGQRSGTPQQAGNSRTTTKSVALPRAFGLVTPSAHSAPRRPARPRVTPGGPAGLGVGSAMFGGDGPLVPDQGRLGRKLAIVRVYDYIGDSFNNWSVDRLMASGTTLLVSLDSRPGGPSYASIAAGHEDRAISRFLRQMNEAAVHYHLNAIYIDFEHEADMNFGYGSPAEFIRAWDHVHALATAAHLDWNQGGRLHWVLILTHFAYFATHLSARWPGVRAFWPGSGEVDIIGVDGYNIGNDTGNCRAAKPGTRYVASGTAMQTPTDLFGPTLRFASAHGNMPVFVAEWASVPYKVPSIQPEFIHRMQSFVTANPEIHAALYWNDHGQGNGCDYVLGPHSASMSALAAMGHSGGLQARALIHG